jgi:hypothetical protein
VSVLLCKFELDFPISCFRVIKIHSNLLVQYLDLAQISYLKHCEFEFRLIYLFIYS